MPQRPPAHALRNKLDPKTRDYIDAKLEEINAPTEPTISRAEYLNLLNRLSKIETDLAKMQSDDKYALTRAKLKRLMLANNIPE